MSTQVLTEGGCIVPLVHLNGSGGEKLAADLQKIANSLRETLEAMTRGAPNARDYYPQGDEAYTRALNEHLIRYGAVNVVLEEVCAIHEKIVDQMEERRRARG